jgi:S-adenosylmethionine decarboxylase
MTDFDFSGTHLIADIYDISSSVVSDTSVIMQGMAAGLERSGATLCGLQAKHFEPTGFTAVYLLSESHVSIHTYPEQNSLFFDAFTCGSRCNPRVFVEELIAALGHCDARVRILRRGIQVSGALDITDARPGARFTHAQRTGPDDYPAPPCQVPAVGGAEWPAATLRRTLVNQEGR